MPINSPVQRATCTVQRTVYSTPCKVSVYSVQCTVYSVQCTLYTVHCTVYSVQCTVYSVQCTVYSVQCTVYSVHCVDCSIRSNLPSGRREEENIAVNITQLNLRLLRLLVYDFNFIILIDNKQKIYPIGNFIINWVFLTQLKIGYFISGSVSRY